jgi:hypothetical protein
MYSTANDMAKFMSQFFRTDTPRSSSQILDGSSFKEILTAVSELRDGRAIYGYAQRSHPPPSGTLLYRFVDS